MLQNAYFLAKIGADTAENERNVAEILPKFCKILAKFRNFALRQPGPREDAVPDVPRPRFRFGRDPVPVLRGPKNPEMRNPESLACRSAKLAKAGFSKQRLLLHTPGNC